jgi:hypothetical protein
MFRQLFAQVATVQGKFIGLRALFFNITIIFYFPPIPSPS